MPENIRGVAFDLDGTLYPNYRLNIRLIPFVLKEGRLLSAFGRARNVIRKEQEESQKAPSQSSTSSSRLLNDNPQFPVPDFYKYQAEITAEILSVNPEQLKEKIERLIYRGWEPLFKAVKLFKGVIETIEALKNAGFKTGLMSDFPPERKLEYLGISGFWDVVQCSEYSGVIKPHPLSFIKLAEAMSMPPENILYVGNSHSCDIRGAAGAGMKTAWLKPLLSGKKDPKPDFSFTNYRQLYNFMIH